MANNIKKILGILIIILFFSGYYYDYSKDKMDLIEVKVYDLEGNEVIGELKNSMILYFFLII